MFNQISYALKVKHILMYMHVVSAERKVPDLSF